LHYYTRNKQSSNTLLGVALSHKKTPLLAGFYSYFIWRNFFSISRLLRLRAILAAALFLVRWLGFCSCFL